MMNREVCSAKIINYLVNLREGRAKNFKEILKKDDKKY